MQGLDRYAYVNNSPMNYVDPSGHEPTGDYCLMGYCDENDNVIMGGSQDDNFFNNTEDDSSCGYHLCSDVNFYEMGWENFGQAWDIWTNPNANYGQKWLAGAYMSYWRGAHAALIAGLLMMGTESTLLAALNNVGISIGFDAVSARLSGQEYTAERALITGSFSLLMGSGSSRITKIIGTKTFESSFINLGAQSVWQVLGNSTFRVLTGQPNTPATFITDLASGGASTVMQAGLPGNPNVRGYYGEMTASLFHSLSPYATSDLQAWP